MICRPFGLAHAAAFVALAALGGCIVVDDDGRSGGGGGGFNRSVEYRCDDDREFTARFDGREARVRAGNETFDLELDRGNRNYREYEGDDGTRLTVDGDEARLRIENERDYAGCEAA